MGCGHNDGVSAQCLHAGLHSATSSHVYRCRAKCIANRHQWRARQRSQSAFSFWAMLTAIADRARTVREGSSVESVSMIRCVGACLWIGEGPLSVRCRNSSTQTKNEGPHFINFSINLTTAVSEGEPRLCFSFVFEHLLPKHAVQRIKLECASLFTTDISKQADGERQRAYARWSNDASLT